MADILQEYFNNMAAINRQRGMTGNTQYGKGYDSSLAQGYFEALDKKQAEKDRIALAKENLNFQKSQANWQQNYLNKQQNQQNVWNAVSSGVNLLGTAALSYAKMNKGTPTTTSTTPQTVWDTESQFKNYDYSGREAELDYYGYGEDILEIDYNSPEMSDWSSFVDLNFLNW